MTNIVRHAKAREVRIRLQLDPNSFTLDIADNGGGPAGMAEKAPSRNGVRNMRKRMEDIRGAFSIGPSPDGGTLVRLTGPLSNP